MRKRRGGGRGVLHIFLTVFFVNYQNNRHFLLYVSGSELCQIFNFAYFPGAQMVKHLAAIWETEISTPVSGSSPGEGNGNPLQYSCLENSMDRGAWWAIVHGVAESQTQLSHITFTLCYVYFWGWCEIF